MVSWLRASHRATQIQLLIDLNIYPRDIPGALSWLAAQIGAPLARRISGFAAEERRNPHIGDYYRSTFTLEYAIAEALAYRKRTGRIPKHPVFDLAYGFAATAERIHSALPIAAQKRLSGQLRGAMNDHYGLRPVAYELQMGVHLMRRGYETEFADLAGNARHDLLATNGNLAIELECKTTSVDVGHQIHRKPFIQAIGSLTHIAALPQNGDRHAIRLIVPGRLDGSPQELAALQKVLEATVRTKEDCVVDGIKSEYTAVDPTQEVNIQDGADALRQLMDDLFGIGNRHSFCIGETADSFVLVSIESSKPDSTIEYIAEQAKAAADQCTGNRPALIAIQLLELTPLDLKTLLDGPSRLLKN